MFFRAVKVIPPAETTTVRTVTVSLSAPDGEITGSCLLIGTEVLVKPGNDKSVDGNLSEVVADDSLTSG